MFRGIVCVCLSAAIYFSGLLAAAQFPSREQQRQEIEGREENACSNGSAVDCEAYGSTLLTSQRFSGLEQIHFHVEGQCLLQRAIALKQQDACTSSPMPSCLAVTAKLQKELSWAFCERGQIISVGGEAAAPGFVPNPNPGCSGTAAIQARMAMWQSPTSLGKGQTVTVWVPPGANGPQTWGVIDPSNRGPNAATGNGVSAGDGFIRPGFPEGALLVRGADQVVRRFDKPDGILSFTAPPGQIAFIANDNYKYNGHPIPPGFGFYGNGFDDNSGSITVKWSLEPCPIAPSSQTEHPGPVIQGNVQIIPSGSCNQVGNEMVLVNGTARMITATIRRDVNGVPEDIILPLAALQLIKASYWAARSV